SQGVPMLVAGDELGRTQQGNNNAYCQDNELSWLDWTPSVAKSALLNFVRRLVALRRAHPAFRRRDFFQGRPLHGGDAKDILWLKPDGREMSQEEWEREFARCLGVYLAGSGLDDVDRRGRRLADDDFLMLFNPHHEDAAFVLPAAAGEPWRALLDTALEPAAPNARRHIAPGERYPLRARSLALLTRPTASAT
ncbi:MAG: glycogen debranching enzyme, partial [Sphingomonadaceae bacterium]